MKKAFTLFTLLAFTVVSLMAAPISRENAAVVCHNFLIQKQSNGTAASTNFKFYKTESIGQEEAYHIFTLEPTGFVVVAASDHFTPILCYSFESDYQPNPGFNYAMSAYANLVVTFEKEGKDYNSDVAAEWQRYRSSSFTAEPIRGTSVSPLVSTKWSQETFYNTYCPWDATAGSYTDGRVVTGCVSTALAQVMKYHGHPYTGVGGSSYIPEPYGRYTVKFYEQTYNFEAMPNSPTQYANEMAKLIHHCGVAVQMNYNPSGSGANSVTAAEAMKRHFKYDSAWICFRGSFDEIYTWHNALKSELNLRRPLYYAAHNGQSGHAFVVDGFDEDTKFHVNWGWGGSSDGYFTISDNNLSDMNSFIYDAEVIRIAYPLTDAPGVITGTKHIDASTGSFYSNMPTINYAPNMQTEWILEAPEASRYTLHFDRLQTEQGVDVITIYNGATEADGVAATVSGTEIPSDITVNAERVLVKFTTDGQNEMGGFQLSFNAQTATQYCGASESITTTGTTIITDGSGDASYRNNSVCTWKINTPNMSRCYFSFPQLELGSGDFVEIYNTATNPATLLYRFDNKNYPATDVITCDNSKLSVRFVADNWDTGNGFTMTVQPVTAINDYARVEDLRIFPNPAAELLNVSFLTDRAESITCEIIDMNGKLVYGESRNHDGGLFEQQISLSDLAQGIYFLRIRTEEGTTMEKFIKTK